MNPFRRDALERPASTAEWVCCSLRRGPHPSSIPARLLQSFGFFLVGIGAAFLLFVAAYPLGLISAYPVPPTAAIEGPLGFERKIEDLDVLYRAPDEPMQDYLRRLTTTVAGGMVHYWTEGDSWAPTDTIYTQVGIFDNYLLWILSFLPQYRKNFQNYEFVEPQKALIAATVFALKSRRSSILF